MDGRSRAQYRYLIFLGNNSDLVRHTLQRRPWWSTAIEDEDSKGNISVTLPSTLFGGAPRYDYTRHKTLAEDALVDNSYHFCWRPTLGMRLYTGDLATIHSIDPTSVDSAGRQLVNHFPSVKCIASKTGLLRSLQRYYSAFGIHPFDNVPTTFILKDIARKGMSEYTRFCNHFRMLSNGDMESAGERMPRKHCKHNMWLVKPAYLNQGKGIKVYEELTPIKEHLMSVDRDGLAIDGAAVSAGAEWVVQKYAEQPLLINGRKFDIRIWVVVDDDFNVYVYQDGYCRTSSELFTLDLGRKPGKRSKEGHDAAQMVHLTNYCMQKHSKNLGAFEEGNTLSFEQLQAYIDSKFGKDGVDFRTQLLPRMKELILDAVLANRDTLTEGSKGRRNFELFGYDFLIDCDFRSWLIEVNTNPYIDKQNPWHHRLLQRMMEDLAALVIDPFFTPTGQITSTFPVMTPDRVEEFTTARKAPGYIPLSSDCYTHAFTYKLNWATTTSASATLEDEDLADDDDDEQQHNEEDDDDGDEHGVDGNAILVLSKSNKPVTAPPPTVKRAPVATPAPPRMISRQPSNSKLDSDDSTALGYRDPRQNGWELLYSEDPRVDPLHIPHQKLMSSNAINTAAVEMCRKRGGVAHVTMKDLQDAGLHMLPSTVSDEEVDAIKSLGPFVCRYIHVRDDDWLYPRGRRDDEEEVSMEDTSEMTPAQAELDMRFQKLKAENEQRRQKQRNAVIKRHESLSKLTAAEPVRSQAPSLKPAVETSEHAADEKTAKSPRSMKLPISPLRPRATAPPQLKPVQTEEVEQMKLPARVTPKPGVPASMDAFAFVGGMKSVDRVVWAVVQLKSIADNMLGPISMTREAPSVPSAMPLSRTTSSGAAVSADADMDAVRTVIHTQSDAETRKLLAAAAKHISAAVEHDEEAAAAACTEGFLAVGMHMLDVCAQAEPKLWSESSASVSNPDSRTNTEEHHDHPLESKEDVSPRVDHHPLVAMIPPRVRDLLLAALRHALVAYKRDVRVRTAAAVPHIDALTRWMAPPHLAPWLLRNTANGAEDAAAAASLAAVRTGQLQDYRSVWAVVATRMPLSCALQCASMRILGHWFAVSRTVGEGEPSPIRESLLQSGAVIAAANLAMIADGDSRKAAREILAYVSNAELRRISGMMEAMGKLSDGAAVLCWPSPAIERLLQNAAGVSLAIYSLSRELSVKPNGTGATSTPSAAAPMSTTVPPRVPKDGQEKSKQTGAQRSNRRAKAADDGGSDAEVSRPATSTMTSSSAANNAAEFKKDVSSGYSSDVGGRRTPKSKSRLHSTSLPPMKHTDELEGTSNSRAGKLPGIPPTITEHTGGQAQNKQPAPKRVNKLAAVDAITPAETALTTPQATAATATTAMPAAKAGESEAERAQRTAVAFEEWSRRKLEEAKAEKARQDAERAAAVADRAVREQLRLERLAEAKRKLEEAKQRQAQRDAAVLKRAMQRAKLAQQEAHMRAELDRLREAAWVGLSSSAKPAAAVPTMPPPAAAMVMPDNMRWGTARTAIQQGRAAIAAGEDEYLRYYSGRSAGPTAAVGEDGGVRASSSGEGNRVGLNRLRSSSIGDIQARLSVSPMRIRE